MQGRRQVEDELEVRERRIQALAGVNLSLSQELDPGRLFQQITDALARLTRTPVVVLWEASMSERRLIRRAWTADASISSVELPSSLSFDEGVAGWMATHRQPVVIDDVTADARVRGAAWAHRHDLLGLAGVPIETGDDLAGILTLNLKRGQKLFADDRALLGSFASQAAVAVRNARLFAEAQARREVAEAVAEVGRVLVQALDPEVAAPRFAESIRTLFLGARATALYRIDPASGQPVVLARVRAPGRATEARAADPGLLAPEVLVELAVRDRQSRTTANLLADQRLAVPAETRAALSGQTELAVLAVPLVVKDAVVGALAVIDVEGRVFTVEEVRVAETFADQAAVALENARLFAEATSGAAKPRAGPLARMFTESLDVSEVARRVVDSMLPVFRAVSSTLGLAEPDGSLRAIAFGGRARQHFTPGSVMPRGAGIMGRVITTGGPAWSRDLSPSPD